MEDWTTGTLLANAIADADLDLAEMEAAIAADPDYYANHLDENQTNHRNSGHWGVPCMVYNDKPFFGQDRIELLKWRVSESRT